jgi:DNA-binding transcriptional MerR regulator
LVLKDFFGKTLFFICNLVGRFLCFTLFALMSYLSLKPTTTGEKTMDKTTHEKEEIVPIGDLCRTLGISTRTLRYWEEVGIIESVDRVDRANRGYTPYMVRRIKFIIRLRDLGLTIKEMQYLYKVYGDAKKTDQVIPELVRIFNHHIGTIDEKITKLNSLRAEIVDYRERLVEKLAESKQKEEKNTESS